MGDGEAESQRPSLSAVEPVVRVQNEGFTVLYEPQLPDEAIMEYFCLPSDRCMCTEIIT